MRKVLRQQPVSAVKWVARNSLYANKYNPNHVAPLELELLKTSILESGWTQPIVVASNGTTIVDGFHRWTVAGDPEVAALTDGYVPVVICSHASIAARMAASVRHNRARGEHAVRPMIALVQRLLRRFGKEKVMKQLGMQKEEVERLALLRSNTTLHSNPGGEFAEAWIPEGPPPVMRD